MPHHTQRAWLRRARKGARVGGLLVVALCHAAALTACQHADAPDLTEADAEALTLRDVLGMSPKHLDGLDTTTRAELRDRALDRAEALQTTDALAAWRDAASPADPADGLAPYHLRPTDPLNVMRRLDQRLADRADDASVFAVFVQGDDGARTHACAPTRDELRALPATHLPDAWHLSENFTDDADALAPLAGGLDRWRARCLEQVGFPQDVAALRVVRQPNAPFLVAYWPQRQSLYVNPALMRLWGAGHAAVVASSASEGSNHADLRTRAQAQEEGTAFGECLNDIRAQCALCTREFATQNPDQCQPIFPLSPIREDCDTLEFDTVDGFVRYCANDLLKAPSIKTCFDATGVSDVCQLPPPTEAISTASDLATYYGGFSNASTQSLCRDLLNTCLSDEDPDTPPPDDTPPVIAEPWEPETLEGQCWSIALNDTYCNDALGVVAFSDLCFYDPKRPEKNEVICSDQQPTNCCGEQGEYPEP